MNLKDLSRPLTVDQIEFRVQSINKGGYATILAYKDARVDQQRLDAVVGPLNWSRQHSRDNHNCTVSIWCDDKKQWVSKEDTGTESNTEKEKGLASDSFKRACFNWGIGRELYDYPVIQVKLNDNEWEMRKGRDGKERPTATWGLRLRDWIWKTQFNAEGKISGISAVDDKGKNRFQWGEKIENQSLQPMLTVLYDNLETVSTIKTALAGDDYSTAKEAWDELTEDEKKAIWVAPSKGGPFTTAEREQMKSTEFREANQ